MLVNATTGFISTLTLDETGHGSSRCPLQIQVISNIHFKNICELSLPFFPIFHLFWTTIIDFTTKICFACNFGNQDKIYP